MRVLEVVLDELWDATRSLLDDVDRLADEDLARPSLLPGWTRGHVVTHLAQNAEGGVRLLRGASSGTPGVEYESVSARAAAIESGAARPAAEQLAHLRAAAGELQRACAAMTREQWDRTVTWTTGQRTPAHVVPRLRLAEVLVHQVDLADGYRPTAWPAGFVHERLDSVVAALNRRRLSPESLRLQATDSGRTFVLHGAAPGERDVLGAEVQLLAWLLGRSAGADLMAGDGRPLPAVPSTYET